MINLTYVKKNYIINGEKIHTEQYIGGLEHEYYGDIL